MVGTAMLARAAARAARAHRQPAAAAWRGLCTGGNISYSGGTTGQQGGFYGSGGARAAGAKM